MIKGKITIELDYVLQDDKSLYDQPNLEFTHPDLAGALVLLAGNENLAKVQLEYLNANKDDKPHPVQDIISSTGKLVEGITKLRDRLKK